MGMNMADEEVKKPLRIDYYVKLVLKRRWLILIPFCIALAGGFLFTISQPRFYEARTLILVVPKSVPDKYVPDLVSSDVGDRINTISQQIKSRTSLEKIVEDYELFDGPQYANMYKEDKLRYMRRNIRVNVRRGPRRVVESFTITYKGKIPVKVMRVVNTLADRFINESIKFMESEVIETRDFIEGELTVMKRRLENVERKMKEYREKHMGELPEQLPSNLKILERLQAQLSERREMMRESKNRLTTLENRIRLASIKGEAGVSLEEEEKQLTPYERMLKQQEQLKQKLADISTRYTDQHPDVIRLKQLLADMKSKIQLAQKELSQKQASVEAAAFEGEEAENAPQTPEDAAIFELKTQREDLLREIDIYQEDIEKINQQIQIYEDRVENTPKREQDLMSLRRGYEDIQRAYSEMLARKLEAQIAVNMERKQKGQKFRIVDRATLPQKPVSPDPKKLFVMFVAAGLALGGGIIFLLEFVDSSLKIPEDIETDLELPVLATIPKIYTKNEKRMRFLDRFLSLGATGAAFFLFCCFALMAMKGVNRTLNLFEKIYQHLA